MELWAENVIVISFIISSNNLFSELIQNSKALANTLPTHCNFLQSSSVFLKEAKIILINEVGKVSCSAQHKVAIQRNFLVRS